jgi:hypothetical protein
MEESVQKNLSTSLVLCLTTLICHSIFADETEDQIEKYMVLAREGKSEEADAKKVAESVLAAEKDADKLNEFAWRILTDEAILQKRDLAMGMRMAKAAYDASEGKNAAIVDTYARGFFESGKLPEAIKFQKKAIELCDDDNLKSDLEETLKRYEKKAIETK